MDSLLHNSVANLFAPRKLKNIVDWIYENCYLRDNISELPGHLKIFPYGKEPLESMVDPMVQKITLCWGSQSSKTTTIYSGLAYLLSEFPKDTLWIMPSAENAKNFSRGRWLPFMEDCKPLREQCPISPETGNLDREKITNMRQEFLSCCLTFTGAGSENNVKSAPVAYLVLDEIDEIDPDIRLASLERIKGRREYKIIQTSTPKEMSGGIWEEYLQGDQRKYLVPCPHCKEKIELTWKQKDKEGKTRYSLTFDEDAKMENGSYDFLRVASTTYYRCQKCDGKILDAHKPEMLKGGSWEAMNPQAPIGHRSYHLNSLYAPAVSFSSLMTNWLQVSNTLHGLRKFIQGNIAEPWSEDSAFQDQNEAHELEQPYERGDLKGEYRILAVDTQTDHFRYIVRGFDRDNNSYLIDFGSVAGFKDLDEKFAQFHCSKAIIDCAGDRTQEVYEEVYKRRNHWFGSRGWKNMAEPYRLQQKDPFTGNTKGRAGQGKFLYLHINKTVWEQEIAQLRAMKMNGFFTFKDTPKDYYDELFAIYWTKETDRSGHIKVVKKKKRHKGDHYFDCECMARALAKFIGIGRVDSENSVNRVKRRPKTPQKSGFWG